MAEVKSSFAVQIKAWHARAAGRRQVAKALGLDAITEALVGLTPELDRFCDEPAARKSIEKRSKKQMCLYTSDLATASCNTERYHVQNILFRVAPSGVEANINLRHLLPVHDGQNPTNNTHLCPLLRQGRTLKVWSLDLQSPPRVY